MPSTGKLEPPSAGSGAKAMKFTSIGAYVAYKAPIMVGSGGLSSNEYSRLNADLSLLKTGYLADAQVAWGTKSWKVHKTILCSRNQWFKKALDGPSKTGVVQIEIFDQLMIEFVLVYLYTGHVPACYGGLIKVMGKGDSLGALIATWSVADHFQLRKVLDFVMSQLLRESNLILKSICTLGLKIPNEVLKDIEVLLRSAYIQFEHAVPCQKLLAGLIHTGRHSLFHHEKFKWIIRDIPGLASDLLDISMGVDKSPWMQSQQGDFVMHVPKGTQRCTLCETGGVPVVYNMQKIGQGIKEYRCMGCIEKSGLPWKAEVGKK